MKAAAKALYDQHRRLITLKVREKRPKDFDERCNQFVGKLDKVFNVAPAGELKPDQLEQFQAIDRSFGEIPNHRYSKPSL